MQEVHEHRSAALRRLQARRNRLTKFLNKRGMRVVDPKVKSRLEEIDMAIEELSRSMYGLD